MKRRMLIAAAAMLTMAVPAARADMGSSLHKQMRHASTETHQEIENVNETMHGGHHQGQGGGGSDDGTETGDDNGTDTGGDDGSHGGADG